MTNDSLIKRIRQLNITSEMAYIAAGASIALSIAIWVLNQDSDRPHAERFGIFVGAEEHQRDAGRDVVDARQRAQQAVQQRHALHVNSSGSTPTRPANI